MSQQFDLVISDAAAMRLLLSNRALGRIMVHYSKGQETIKRYARNRDYRLGVPEVINILQEELGMSREEILVPNKKIAKPKNQPA